MSSEYYAVATPGGLKLQRRFVKDSTVEPREFRGGGGHSLGVPSPWARGRGGRPVTGFSPKARRQMRWVWNALPWDELDRLAMITLTYPGDWRGVCPDGLTLKRHLRAFRERWRRRWGAPRGAWVVEYQPRASRPEAEQFAPHFHLYMEVPQGAAIERDATDDRLVWDWARQAWHEIVVARGSGRAYGAHRYWGVHYRQASYGAGLRNNAKRVGDYLWRESGKLEQKEAPEGFEGVKWWDVWGMKPIEHEVQITEREFVEMRRPMRTLRDERTGAKVQRPRGMDGLSVTNVDGASIGVRLYRWAAERAASEEGHA